VRIAFDVSALRAPQSGVATYTANLLQHLERLPHDEILPMAHRPVAMAVNGASGASSRGPVLNKTLWMQALLPFQLSRVAADVCHFTNSVGSWWTPCPSVVTIHDTTLWLFPKYHPRRRLLAMRPFIPLGASRAKAIIAVSHATKRDVVRTLKVPERKVHVIYEAPARHFRPLPRGEALEAVRRKHGLPESFVLYVGTIEPRKNLARLLEAFELLRRDGFGSHALVMVGSPGWKDGAILRNIERLRLRGAVRLLGHTSAEDLVALYNLADVLAFPSLYEGFGLPVVEAMACGTPVVTSPNGSLAEIAGTAAELVDPTQVENIAAGLRSVLSDPDRRAALRTAGLAQAARFSWEATAAQTRQVYESVLGA
jgi:glycosyltransferase involved in cell wall biosynthesis